VWSVGVEAFYEFQRSNDCVIAFQDRDKTGAPVAYRGFLVSWNGVNIIAKM
jgi:hypothetical protein